MPEFNFTSSVVEELRKITTTTVRITNIRAQVWTLTSKIRIEKKKNYATIFVSGVRGGATGWGTALKAGRSRVRFPVVSLEFFIDNPFGRTVALGSTQRLAEMSSRNIFGGKIGRCVGLTTLSLPCAIVLKSRSLILLEPLRPVQTCNGIAFIFVSSVDKAVLDNLRDKTVPYMSLLAVRKSDSKQELFECT